MPSPFPGMDPYLEGRRIWPGVHARLIVAIADYLTPLVEPAYYVEVEERVYVTPVQPEERIVHPDVARVPACGCGPPEPPSRAGGLAVAIAMAIEAQAVTVPSYERVQEHYLEVRDAGTEALITS